MYGAVVSNADFFAPVGFHSPPPPTIDLRAVLENAAKEVLADGTFRVQIERFMHSASRAAAAIPPEVLATIARGVVMSAISSGVETLTQEMQAITAAMLENNP